MNLRTALLTATFAFASSGVFAQQTIDPDAFFSTSYEARNSGSFSKNHRLFSLSYGFPTALGDGFGYSRIGFGPVMARYEAPIRDEIGLAGLVQIGARKSGRYDDRSFAFGFGGMAFYHFNKLIPVRELDVYAGFGIGINFTHVSREGADRHSDSYVDPLPIGAIGARYYFTPGVAGFVEAGFTGMSSVNLGVTWRL